MCCFHTGDWALPERGGGRKGLPGWFRALFSHVCLGGKRACQDVLEHFFPQNIKPTPFKKGLPLHACGLHQSDTIPNHWKMYSILFLQIRAMLWITHTFFSSKTAADKFHACFQVSFTKPGKLHQACTKLVSSHDNVTSCRSTNQEISTNVQRKKNWIFNENNHYFSSVLGWVMQWV